MGIHQALQDFIINTSVGGIRRVFFPVGSGVPAKYFRLLWFLAWAASAAFMTKQITNIFHQYLQYKTNTKVYIDLEDQQNSASISDRHNLRHSDMEQ